MRDRYFFDTNVLVYLYSISETEKRKTARLLLCNLDIDIIISTQVLGEFANILFKKYEYSLEIIREILKDFKDNFEISIIKLSTIELALQIMKKYRYSYWDSVILASAFENDCPILYSEDMHHNQLVEDNLRIVNPFATPPIAH